VGGKKRRVGLSSMGLERILRKVKRGGESNSWGAFTTDKYQGESSANVPEENKQFEKVTNNTCIEAMGVCTVPKGTVSSRSLRSMFQRKKRHKFKEKRNGLQIRERKVRRGGGTISRIRDLA